MNARQNLKDTSHLVIPIPEGSIPVLDHSSVYQRVRGQPHSYIRMPGKIYMYMYIVVLLNSAVYIIHVYGI